MMRQIMAKAVHLRCRLCDQAHGPVVLSPGERAYCARCGTMMAKQTRFGPDAGLALALAGLVFALPAALLPFISARKLGDERDSLLFTGVATLWHHDMRTIAVLIVLCGALLPVAFLVALAWLHAPPALSPQPAARRYLFRCAHFLEHWAFPEVQVLAVLVALMRLGSLVDVSIGAGFWSYCAMSIFLLLAHRNFDFESSASPPEALAAS